MNFEKLDLELENPQNAVRNLINQFDRQYIPMGLLEYRKYSSS